MEAPGQAQAQAMEASIQPLQAAIKDVELLSGRIPVAEDFHFYNNFSQFKHPVAGLSARAQALLAEIGTCKHLRAERSGIAQWPQDVEESYGWLVGVQDDVLEGVGSALDEMGLGPGKRAPDFLLSKSKKRSGANAENQSLSSQKAAKVTPQRKERLPIPFHVRSIPRPQDKFDYPVDNSNSPFRHLSREAVLGKSQAIEAPKILSTIELHAQRLGMMNKKVEHPLKEELTSMTFLKDFPVEGEKPLEPKKLSETPFFVMENLSSLEAMASKLRASKEIAVDLEHHHYRSFQGIVCLMQISTRSEDFVVDTLALRSHIGPVLRSVFANPSIRKVIHGSDRDILWLQRDCGIYVCNMFDTGQAARVLRMDSFGLAFLLQTFCGVQPDKRYQLADWRLRPLTAEMLKYAREDTHYLLYIYDKLKEMLKDGQATEDLYMEVCKRSTNLCLQLYEKELLTETSFLHIYGLAEKRFTPEKLAIVAGLYAWRDKLCRSEDESTGYILPNSLLFRIAEEAPKDTRKLLGILKHGHPVAALHCAALVKVIREAPKNAVTLQALPLPVPSKPDEVEEGEIHDLKEQTSADVQVEVVTSVKQVPLAPQKTSLPLFEEPGFDTVEAPPAETTPRETPTVQVKRSPVASGLFSTSSVQADSEDEDDKEATAKALAIRASVKFSFPGLKVEQEKVTFETDTKSSPMEREIMEEVETDTVEAVEAVESPGDATPKLEEVLSFEKENEDQPTSTTETTSGGGRNFKTSELPLSLNERYNKHQKNSPRDRDGLQVEPPKKPKNKPTKRASDDSVQESTREDSVRKSTIPFSVKRDKKEAPFDPSRDVDSTPEGIQQAGKRRSVFPKSGNRTGFFM